MADLYNLEQAMVTQIALSLFPDGSYLPGSIASSPIIGSNMKIYRGWPQEATLDTDLIAGTCNISVFPSPGMARITTRYLREYQDMTQPATTFAAAVLNNTVTFSGTASVTQVVGVQVGNTAYTYRMLVTDTPTSVAAQFAAHIPSSTSVGPVLTITTTLTPTANVLADGKALYETKRQEQLFRVSVWSPTPAIRDVVSAAIDVFLSNVRQLDFADGSHSGPVWYRGTHVDDAPEKEHLWIRHSNYVVDYPTVITPSLPRAMFIGGTVYIDLVAHQPFNVQLLTDIKMTAVESVASVGALTF